LRADRHASAAGFTLLELLVVLALLALVTGLVAPAAVRAIGAARERAASADLGALLEGLPMRSFRAGAAQAYSGEALRLLLADLPSGWTVEAAPPLRYTAQGVAAGGTVRLLAPGRPALALRVLPVSGEVVRNGAAP
jgi:prepilin-type N-terminal cleavage/methylation domain-containing protein